MAFSPPREKGKSLSFNRLGSIFIDFFTILEKTFRVPLVPCPQPCPRLVPRTERDREVIEKEAFSPRFCACPAYFQQKRATTGYKR